MIYLIEKLWIDPMENTKACGYDPYAFVNTESAAKKICETSKAFTEKDCWEIKYTGPLKQYRYKKIEYFKK